MGLAYQAIGGEIFGRRTCALSLSQVIWNLLVDHGLVKSNPSDVIARWRAEGYISLNRNPDGLRLKLSRRSTLNVRPDGTQFEGSAADIHSAVRATVEFLRDRGDGVITADGGSDDYKMSLWAHARLMNMVVCNFNPIPVRQEEAFALVEKLREQYARAGSTPEQYEGPRLITNAVQAYHSQNRLRHLHEMVF